jgi:hypothetical protein
MTLLSVSLPNIPSSPLSASSSSSSTLLPKLNLESVLVKRLLLDGKLENNEEFFVRLESEKRLAPENNPPPLVVPEEDKLKAPNKGFFPLVSLLLESFLDKLPKSPPDGALLNKPPELGKLPNNDSFLSLFGCSFKFNASFLSLFDDVSFLKIDLVSVLD